MNSRERKLIILLVACVGVGGGGLGVYAWFVKPLIGYNKAILNARDERDLEELKWNTFLAEQQKLAWARVKSLPTRPELAASEYERYLERMIEKTELKLVGINYAAAVKVKPTGTVQGVKEVGHQIISFNLIARGELPDLVKFMELLRSTPYEHRIKTMSIDRADNSTAKTASKTLNITMTIEALLVGKSDNGPGHPPGLDGKYLAYDFLAARSDMAPLGWGMVGSLVALKQNMPRPAGRDYAEVSKKNIFVGAFPSIRGPVGPGDPGETGPVEPRVGNIPAFIRLVHTVQTNHEAYLLNLYYRNEEFKLSDDPKSGYQVRRISTDNGDHVFFFMKVLRIDPGVVYFQKENQVYAISLGQTLADAIQEPLSIDRMDDLDLDWDRDWAKQQMKTEEKSQGGRPSPKKGSKKGM